MYPRAFVVRNSGQYNEQTAVANTSIVLVFPSPSAFCHTLDHARVRPHLFVLCSAGHGAVFSFSFHLFYCVSAPQQQVSLSFTAHATAENTSSVAKEHTLNLIAGFFCGHCEVQRASNPILSCRFRYLESRLSGTTDLGHYDS